MCKIGSGYDRTRSRSSVHMLLLNSYVELLDGNDLRKGKLQTTLRNRLCHVPLLRFGHFLVIISKRAYNHKTSPMDKLSPPLLLQVLKDIHKRFFASVRQPQLREHLNCHKMTKSGSTGGKATFCHIVHFWSLTQKSETQFKCPLGLPTICKKSLWISFKTQEEIAFPWGSFCDIIQVLR